MKQPDLSIPAALFAMACAASREHDRLTRHAMTTYGDYGPLISGCVREHFPDPVREALRTLARTVGTYSDAAYAARPPRVRLATMRRLAQDIATRDGAGYYGPQGVTNHD